MADYYAVLKRTLSGFGEPSESLRSKIYEKARSTIARQLDATQPPLSDETKAAQLTQLDEAIVRMEAEYAPPADDFVGTPPPLPIGDAAPQEEVAPAEDTAPPVEPTAEPIVDPVIETPPPPVVETEPVVEAVPVAPVFEPTPPPVSVEPASPAVDATDPIAEAFAAIEAARNEAEVGSANDEVQFDAAAFDAAARDEAAAAPSAPSPEPVERFPKDETAAPPAGNGDIFDDPAVNARDAAALGAAGAVTRRPQRKSGRGVLWFLLLVAAVGLLFVFRAPLLAAVGVERGVVDRFVASIPGVGPYLVGEVDDPNDPTRPKPVPTIRITPEPETPEPPEETGKLEQRLGTDGQEIEPAEQANALPAPTLPDAPGAAPQPEPQPQPQVSSEIVPITPVAPEPEPAVEPDTAPEVVSAELPAAETPTVAVAQSAILFEEGSGSRETRSDRGNVVWSVVQESPGNGEPAEPAIRAVLDVPERSLKATLTIRRNSDLGLAASHLMEVNFEPSEGFSGNNIDEVLAVRMKPEERGQGTPLSVIPAKIAPGYFYVALDNLPAARDRNIELMRTAKWIDVPVEYVTGRRALISLEKGVVGERVFSEALAAWDAATQ